MTFFCSFDHSWTKRLGVPWKVREFMIAIVIIIINIKEEIIYHTVGKGDNLTKIARKYGTTLNELSGLNPQIKNLNLIYIGDKVRVK